MFCFIRHRLNHIAIHPLIILGIFCGNKKKKTKNVGFKELSELGHTVYTSSAPTLWAAHVTRNVTEGEARTP